MIRQEDAAVGAVVLQASRTNLVDYDGDLHTECLSLRRCASHHSWYDAKDMAMLGCDTVNDILIVHGSSDILDGVSAIMFVAIGQVFGDVALYESADRVLLGLLAPLSTGGKAGECDIDAAVDTEGLPFAGIGKDAGRLFPFFSLGVAGEEQRCR